MRQQPPDDVLAALVEDHLDDRLAGVGVDDPEGVDLHRAVVELDPGAQAPGEVARHRARDLGEIGLAHLVATGAASRWASSPSLVSSSRPSVSCVEPADVDEPPGQVADHVADGRPVAVVAHGGDHARSACSSRRSPGRRGSRCGRRRPRSCRLARVDPHALHLHDCAVHADPAGLDHVLADAPRADAGAGEDLLQPLSLTVVVGAAGARGRPGGQGRAPCPRTSPRPAAVVVSSSGVAAFIAVQSPTPPEPAPRCGLRPTRPRCSAAPAAPRGPAEHVPGVAGQRKVHGRAQSPRCRSSSGAGPVGQVRSPHCMRATSVG